MAIRRWGDPNIMGERIRAKVKEINDNYLPDGVQIRNTYDRTDLVNYTLRTIGKTLVEGVVVVSLVLIFLLEVSKLLWLWSLLFRLRCCSLFY